MTTSLQKIHAVLKKRNTPFYKQRSKTIDSHFVLVDYQKYSCSIAVYYNLNQLKGEKLHDFFIKNGKEIQDLYLVE